MLLKIKAIISETFLSYSESNILVVIERTQKQCTTGNIVWDYISQNKYCSK
jgi:hypothetical protein